MDVVVSDNDLSSSEGDYEPGGETREAVDVEAGRMMDDVGPAAAAVGFGISGIGEGKMVLGRVGQRDDKELRYLHLLWEPGRADNDSGGVASKLGKVTGSRARRHHRAVRNLGPIGKDIYGKTAAKHTKYKVSFLLTLIVKLISKYPKCVCSCVNLGSFVNFSNFS